MRRIAVVSVGRSDRGHLTSVYEALRPHVFWSATYTHPKGDAGPREIGRCMTAALDYYSAEWDATRPDLILLFGDRYEQFAAATAALPFAIPLAHLHGGETTTGAFDNQIRHALTKLSHLHLVSHRRHADVIAGMGEEPWRIHVTGAPGLDRLVGYETCDEEGPVILLTLHPCTLEYEQTAEVADAVVNAVRGHGPVVWTLPNADTHGAVIRERFTAAFGEPTETDDAGYLSIMCHADVMIGNSSSGIIEAPSFKLPVVNIGNRQAGRLRGDNVIDVPAERHAIAHGIRRALDPLFRAGLSGANPYGDGQSGPRIARILRSIPLDRRLLEKP